jgi:hypothetical protein
VTSAAVTGVFATGYCGAYNELLLQDGDFLLLESGGNFVLQNEISYTAEFSVTGVAAQGAIGSVTETYGGSAQVNGVFATGVIGTVLLWSDVVDAQNPDWTMIPDMQDPNWTNIHDSQPPNWVNVA